jgi:hypothetical protein
MINFNLPGMYELSNINLKILNLIKKYPNYFYDNIKINAVYGNPQYCIWDGGRIFPTYKQTSIEKITDLIYQYNQVYDIPIRYVFTNSILNKEKHYSDRFGNLLLELGKNYKNEIVVSDDNFGYFLKEKYPNYNLISSTTKCIVDKNELKQELHKDLYSLVCLDYNFNYDLDFLQTFSQEEKEKTEFLVNAICPANCPQRKNHYYLNSLNHLNYGKPYKMEHCLIKDNGFNPDVKMNNNNLTYNQIENIYYPMGFHNFKIEGRTWDEKNIALLYIDYLVKPEYKSYILSILLQ